MAVNRHYEKDGTVHRIYDSISDMIGEADIPNCERDYRYDSFDTSFIGRRLCTWKDVKKACDSVWSEGDSIVEGMLAQLGSVDLPKPKCRKRKRCWSEDTGDEVDFDRLRTGQPFWRESRRQQSHGSQFVTLVVDVAANADVKADKILWRGAAAVILTKLLEEAGYRVELWGCFNGRGTYSKGPSNIFSATCLKRPQEPLDIQSLTIAVSGWFFRTVGFRTFCVPERSTNYSLGSHRVPDNKLIDEITPDANRKVLHSVWSQDAAINLIRTTVAEIDSNSMVLA